MTTDDASDPHRNQPLLTRGAALADATRALVLVHGRGASAEAIAALADDLPTDGVAVLAPQAGDDTWYPGSFLAPVAENEPRRTAALEAVGRALERATTAGVPADRVVIAGFSQGACVAADLAARAPRRYGGLAVLSGGLMGETLGEYDGSLDGTPVLFACSDEDPYIPEDRVRDSAAAFERLGGDVTVQIDAGGPHAITDEAIAWVAARLDALG